MFWGCFGPIGGRDGGPSATVTLSLQDDNVFGKEVRDE